MNKDKRLASFLTTLLGVCVVTEATLGTYVGLKMFMAKQEQEFQAARYEAYLEEQEQRRENPPKIQYAGPTMRVVDGVLMDWDDNIIPDPVPVESGKTAPAVSMPKPNLEENTIEPEAVTPVQQTSKPVDSAGSNSSNSKADSSGSTSGNQSSGTAKPSGNSQSSGVSATPSNENQGNQSSNNTTTNSKQDTYTHDYSNGRVLGTTESDKYHCSDCIGARKIPQKNEKWYDSASDAEADGRKPCGICYK